MATHSQFFEYLASSRILGLSDNFMFYFQRAVTKSFQRECTLHNPTKNMCVSISSYPCCINNVFFISNPSNLNFCIFLLVNLVQCLSFERTKLEFHCFYQFLLILYSSNLIISFFWLWASFYFSSFLSWMVTLLI